MSGLKARVRASLVHVFLVYDRPRRRNAIGDVGDLGAEKLWSSFVHAYAIGEVGEMPALAVVDGPFEQRECLALEVELVVGVLRDQPCRLCTVIADERSSRPAMLGDDRSQPVGICWSP